LDQAIASEPFAWSDVPSTKAERWALGKTFTFFCGSHDGYERMVDPVIHHRSILRVNARDDEGLWLIRDVLLGDTQHELEQNWHFAPEISTERVSDFEFAVSMAEADQPRLRIIIPARSVWKSETQKARVSPAYGRYETAQVLRFRAQIKLPAESGTVMITEAVNTLPRHEWQLSSTELPLVQVYELRDQYYRHEFFFARSKQLWSFGPWSADAEAVYCRIESERITQLIVIAASEVAWAEEPLFKTSDRFQFFEWRSSDDVKNAEPASVTTTPHFDVLTQRRNVTSDSATSTHSYEEKR